MQETNTPNAPVMPEDQPFQFDGLEGTGGRDAAFLVRDDFASHCSAIDKVTPLNAICWCLIAHAEAVPATAVADPDPCY